MNSPSIISAILIAVSLAGGVLVLQTFNETYNSLEETTDVKPLVDLLEDANNKAMMNQIGNMKKDKTMLEDANIDSFGT